MRINNRTDFELVLSLKDNATQKIIPLPTIRFKIELYTREAVSSAKRITIWSDDQNAKRSDDGLRLKVAVHVDDNLYLPNGTLMARFYFEQANAEYPDGVRHTQRPIDTGVIIWAGDSDLPSSINVELLTSYLKGDAGLSAYQLYRQNNPDASLTEKQYANASIKALQETAKVSQLVIKEIIHDFVPLRPKGHTMWVHPSVESIQVAGVLPRRSVIRAVYEQTGRRCVITESDSHFAVPVFDRVYIEEMKYELTYRPPGSTFYYNDSWEGYIDLKIKPEAYRNLHISSHTNRTLLPMIINGKECSGSISDEDLRDSNGWVRIRIGIGEITLNLRIIFNGLWPIPKGQYLKVGEDHQLIVLGCSENGYGADVISPPYIGRINPFSVLSEFCLWRSNYAELLNNKLKLGRVFTSELADDVPALLSLIGFGNIPNGYGLFVRRNKKSGSGYSHLKSGCFISYFGFPKMAYGGRQMHRALKTRTKLMGQSIFNINYIDCCIARIRYRKSRDGGRTIETLDMRYSRFDFRIRAIYANHRQVDYPESEYRGRISMWQVQK